MQEEIVGQSPSNESEDADPSMLSETNWDEFRKSGLMWWVNRQLHLFGWTLVAEVDAADPERTLRVYPAKTKFRGMCEDVEERGFKNLTSHLRDNIEDLSEVSDNLDPKLLGD